MDNLHMLRAGDDALLVEGDSMRMVMVSSVGSRFACAELQKYDLLTGESAHGNGRLFSVRGYYRMREVQKLATERQCAAIQALREFGIILTNERAEACAVSLVKLLGLAWRPT